MYTKNVTLQDIAEQCGVSQSAVSCILNSREDIRIAPQTRKRVLHCAAEMGYRVTGRKGRTSETVAIYVSGRRHTANIGTSFFVNVAQAIRQKGLLSGIQIFELIYDPSEEIRFIKSISDLAPEIVITQVASVIDVLRKHNMSIPAISVQSGEPGPGSSAYHVDDQSVGRLAAKVLIENKYSNITLLFPVSAARSVSERFSGFQQVFEQTTGRYKTVEMEDYFGKPDIRSAVRDTINRSDAYYCFSDGVALKTMQIIQQLGRRIPEDIGVVGTDNLYWSEFFYPALTTMDLHEDLFAERIIRDILHVKKGKTLEPVCTRIPVNLIRRRSTSRSKASQVKAEHE